MATPLTLKSGNAASGGDNASGALTFEIGENYGVGASTITFKTRASGANTNTPGALQTTLLLNTDNEVVVNEGKLKLGSTAVTSTATELNLLAGVTGTLVTEGGTHTLTNKTIDSANNTLTLDLSEGTLTGTTAEFNTALSDGSFATLAGSETLTNKTLTSAVLTTPQINDTSADHQYVFAVSELTLDRTVTLPLLTGNDEFVFKDHTVTLTNKTIDSANNTLTLDLSEGTLTGTTAQFNTALSDGSFATLAGTETLSGKTLTAPKIAHTGYIADSSNNEYLIFSEAATAVNQFQLSNAATGNHPNLAVTGSDANINLELTPKGTGVVNITAGGLTVSSSQGITVGAGGAADGKITLFSSNVASNSTIIKASASATSDATYTLPTAPPAGNDYVLSSSTNGVMSWAVAAGGGVSAIDDLTDAIAGGAQFGNSLLLGNATTGTLATAVNNTGVGFSVFGALTEGDANSALGQNSLNALTTGSRNVAIGKDALSVETVGSQSVCVGQGALSSQSNRNLVIGDTSTTGGNDSTTLGLTNGFNITAGYYVGQTVKITDGGGAGTNVFGAITAYNEGTGVITFRELNGTSVTDTTAVTYDIGAGVQADNNINNTAVGRFAGSSITFGFDNTLLGSSSASSLTYGYRNTALGNSAGSALTTGYENTVIGNSAGASLTTGFNNTVIGHNATASAVGASNEITLGNSSITDLRCADTTIASLSDARDKTDVIDLPWGLDFIDSLRPVQFTWDRRVLTPDDENWHMNGKKRAGFLAQELQSAMTDNANEVLDLVYESNPERLEVKQGKLVPMLTQAIKELKAELDTLKAEVAALKNAAN